MDAKPEYYLQEGLDKKISDWYANLRRSKKMYGVNPKHIDFLHSLMKARALLRETSFLVHITEDDFQWARKILYLELAKV